MNYYLHSIMTLLQGVQNWPVLLKLATRNPSDDPLELKLRDGLRFRVSTLMDAWIIKETLLDREYEAVSLPLEPNWTVVDIGAALGDYAVWAAQQLPQGKVIAIEPFPRSVKLLQENLTLNSISNVEVAEVAIGGQDGLSSLQIVTGQAVQHSTASLNAAGGSLAVEVRSLGTFLTEYHIEQCDYLKIDCEGGEYEILFGCKEETLAKIRRICMEVHDGVTLYSRKDMVSFLEKNGYRTRLTANPVHNELAYLYAERTR